MQKSFEAADFMEVIPDPSLLVNDEGIILRTNRLADDFFGYGEGELWGHPVEILVPVELRELHVGLRSRYHSEGAHSRKMGQGLALSAVRKSGARVPVEVGLSPVPGQGILTIVKDATLTQQQLAQMALVHEQFDERLHYQRELLAEISHEIRTPLASAVMLMDHLRQTVRGEEEQELLENICQDCRHISGLLDAILEQSKRGVGHCRIELCPFSPSELLLEVHSVTRLRAEQRKVDLRVKTEGLPPLLMSDPLRLRQILLNLIENALKFTPPEGRITLRAAYDEKSRQLSFQVIDTGVGMPAEEHERIFQSHIQGEAGDRSHRGNGLGLAISRTLVELLGGRITVRSQPGNGSKFSFWVEAKPVQEVLGPEVEPQKLEDLKRRILLVEDNAVCARAIQLALEHEGHQVHCVASVREALAWGGTPEVVILDLGLPDGTGLQLLQALRSQQPSGFLAIALSGRTEVESGEEARQAGFDCYFTKPPDVGKLKQVVRHLPGLSCRKREPGQCMDGIGLEGPAPATRRAGGLKPIRERP